MTMLDLLREDKSFASVALASVAFCRQDFQE